MSVHLSLAPLLESFFRNRLTKQRNATPATIASYRDALRMPPTAPVASRAPWRWRSSTETLFWLFWTSLRRSGRIRSQHAMRA